jgi:DNA polymerase-4
MSRALRLCPDAVRVPPRFERYGEISHRVMAYFRSITPLVEPLSLDEAFLDVSAEVDRHGGAEALARRLKSEVRRRTALTISVGVGTNKTVAKIASDMRKPDGLVIVAPGEEAAFLAPLPVRALWGVGPKAEATLHAAGLRTVADLAQARTAELERRFGPRGLMLQEMARGHDDRPVEPVHERRSIGAETTFARDLEDGTELRAELERVAREAAHRLVAHGSLTRTIALKLRYASFRTITRQTSLPEPTDDVGEIVALAHTLLTRVVEPGDRFRLIGVQCTNLSGEERRQLTLWSGASPDGAVLG